MRRITAKLSPFFLIIPLLTGCQSAGEKAASVSVIYGTAAVLSLLLLVGYCTIAKKREVWYLLLFASVLVVNIGYLALSISKGLDEALLANRLSYLGSVFLPLSMLMIILNATHICYKKWLPTLLLSLAVAVFLVAASPGYLPVYYEEVSLAVVDGAAVLQKVYGPLHNLYPVYLLGYFSTMIGIIVYATIKDMIDSLAYTVMIAIAVFVNIGVWMIEQLVHIDFGILSVSYIISESFLLGLHILMAEAEKQENRLLQQAQDAPQLAAVPETESAPEDGDREMIAFFLQGLSSLTPKERELYECYAAGMSTDVIMEKLAIKENTLKFHNKNLYSKLGVKSRKQLTEICKKLP